ncbi:MAG: hypothetical protein PF447_02695 [Spirochaetaceae bacterium]|jgi:hypothetical protein|nr:hypothetical protein [Spirochaetaceae bacterium]
MNWLENNITFDLTYPLPTDSMNPSHRYETEQFIESRAPQIITKEIGQLRVDSLNLLSDLLYQDPIFYTQVENKIAGMNKTFSRSTSDMKSFMLRYTMAFYPFLVEMFMQDYQTVPVEFFSPLDYHRENFTGIIIYAQDDYPLHGSLEMVQLNPALFPRIWDPQLNLVYHKEQVEREYLLQWGMVHYSRDPQNDDNQWAELVGNKPLQISARSIYGKNHCDIILSQEDSRLILSNEEENQLLSQSRILIQLPPETL